jgi:hypothetical protein
MTQDPEAEGSSVGHGDFSKIVSCELSDRTPRFHSVPSGLQSFHPQCVGRPIHISGPIFPLRLGRPLTPRTASLQLISTSSLRVSRHRTAQSKFCRAYKWSNSRPSKNGQISLIFSSLILLTKKPDSVADHYGGQFRQPGQLGFSRHRRLRRQSPVGFPSSDHSEFGVFSFSLLQVLLKNTAIRQAKSGQFLVNSRSIVVYISNS